jgi:hypothetical protein
MNTACGMNGIAMARQTTKYMSMRIAKKIQIRQVFCFSMSIKVKGMGQRVGG